MEKMPSRRDVLKGLAAGGIAALGASRAEAQGRSEELAQERAEILRLTNELEIAQKAHDNELDATQKARDKELQQKLLKELGVHLKKAIDLTNTK